MCDNQLLLRLLMTLFLGLLSINESAADFYRYTFNGVIPDGASNHSMVADGESWTASFIVDSNTVDVNSSPQIGVYEGAVVSGSLEFSGGYIASTTEFSGADAFALDDVFFADSVRIRGESGLSDFVFQANSEDLSTLDTDLLPVPGTVINPFPDQATFEYFQLSFDDELGTIFYFANQANNVSFTASLVPEPTAAFVLLVTFSAICHRRRSV